MIPKADERNNFHEFTVPRSWPCRYQQKRHDVNDGASHVVSAGVHGLQTAIFAASRSPLKYAPVTV